jgi:hypothetical protein
MLSLSNGTVLPFYQEQAERPLKLINSRRYYNLAGEIIIGIS